MSAKTNIGIPLEPERYELRAAAPYRFDLDRRDFFKFLGAGVVACRFSSQRSSHKSRAGQDNGGENHFHSRLMPGYILARTVG